MNGNYVNEKIRELKLKKTYIANIIGITVQNLHQRLRSERLDINFLKELAEKIHPRFIEDLPIKLNIKKGNNSNKNIVKVNGTSTGKVEMYEQKIKLTEQNNMIERLKEQNIHLENEIKILREEKKQIYSRSEELCRYNKELQNKVETLFEKIIEAYQNKK